MERLENCKFIHLHYEKLVFKMRRTAPEFSNSIYRAMQFFLHFINIVCNYNHLC